MGCNASSSAEEGSNSSTIDSPSMSRETLLMAASICLIAVNVLPNFIDVPINLAMLCTSFCCIIVAAHRSLAVNSDPETRGQVERITTEDAYQFPLVASAGLFSLFVVFTFFKKYVSVLLTIYSCVLGSCSLGSFIYPVFKMMGLPTGSEFNIPIPSIPAPIASVFNAIGATINKVLDMVGMGESEEAAAETPPEPEPEDDFVTATPLQVLCFLIGFSFGAWYYIEEHWSANNALGVGLAITGIEYINVGSFFVGAILLSGLFFYDIFWVFLSKPLIGKNVMVTVAKNFKGPIKFLFKKPGCVPKAALCAWDTVKNVTGACIATAAATEYKDCPTLFEQVACEEKKAACFSLLGLGDVVLPGIFIALLLRFDESRNKPDGTGPGRVYFHSVLFAYLVGLAATYFAMIWSNHAQPALLYLVPACVGLPSLFAMVRGESKELFAYDEEGPAPEPEAEEKKEK